MDRASVFPDHGLPLTGRENLESKARSVEKLLSSFEGRGFPEITSHGKEVLAAARGFLADADSAADLQVALSYYTLAWFDFEALNHQIETFQVGAAGRSQPRYVPTEFVLRAYSKRAGLAVPPILSLGGSYYSTGSFGYQARERRRLRPFYQISSDCSDSLLLLPALAHEVFHCGLNETGFAELRSVLVERGLQEEQHAERLEEALCDALATRIAGPAFMFAFMSKYWQLPPEVVEMHPRDSFRVRVMYDQIHRACDGPTADRLTAHWKIEQEDSDIEPLSILADDISDFAAKRIRSPFSADFLTDDIRVQPDHRDPIRLLNVAWLNILEGRWPFAEADGWASDLLERWSRPGDSSA